MRSSRSGPDPLDPGPAGFAHRGLHRAPGIPENSLAAFSAALEAGAGIEFDARLSADDEIIIFHDADARRMCASKMKIGEATLQQLSHLRASGHPIPTLESVLSLVAGEVPLLLEVKTANDVRRWIPALRRRLLTYGGPLGVMSFDPRIGQQLKRSLPHVRRGLVIKKNLSTARRILATWLAQPQFIAVERSAIDSRWVQLARSRMPVYCWTIRTEAERAQAAVHADALIWESDGRPRN